MGDLEEHLQVEAREVFRQLLRDHLELREEPAGPVTGGDGVARPYVEARGKSISRDAFSVRVLEVVRAQCP